MNIIHKSKIDVPQCFYITYIGEIKNKKIKLTYSCKKTLNESCKLEVLTTDGWVTILDMVDVGYLPNPYVWKDLKRTDIEKKANDLFEELTNTFKKIII